MGFKNIAIFAPTLLSTAAAQFSGWAENQINTTICNWKTPRAALIRDTVYIDGGILTWMPGLENGELGAATPEGGFQRLILSYNLSNPIDSTTNVTSLLIENTLERPPGGLGANFEDGAMLANDYEFLLYGGNIQFAPAEYEPPDGDEIIGYQLFRYGAERTWVSNWDEVDLGNDTNRYIVYGGAASAPSENKAWYFSGMTAPGGGEIEIGGVVDGSTTADRISKRFIQVDMEVQSSEVWTNNTLPSNVKGRANPEMVWVPVGDEGILVVLGGVVYPHWVTDTLQSEDPEKSEEESPVFMREIDVYDVAGGEWYKQNTTGGPGARTRGCAVLATASDQSSYNIYYYGGFDGISPTEPFDDTVWVLSLPSFTWTNLNEGSDSHARAGHKCFTPYADQMLVVGGYRSMPGTGITCLNPGPFVFFNMSSGDWMDSYHPEKYSDYGVPDKVVSAIGGDAAGGATLSAPSPSGWDDDDLGDIFSKTYDMEKITTYSPYPAVETPTSQPDPPEDGNSDENGDDDDDDGGLPSWVAPVLGVVLGLMALTGAVVAFFLWRKRKIFRNDPNSGVSDTSTEDTSKWIRQWMRGQPQPNKQQPVDKAPTVITSEETATAAATSPEMRSVSAMKTDPYPSPPLDITEFHETAGNPVAELQDTSRAELSDTQSDTYMQRRSHYGEYGRPMSVTDPSHTSLARGGGLEASSVVSGSSAAAVTGPEESTESPVAPNHGPYRLSDPGYMRSLSETLAGQRTTTVAEDPDAEVGESSRPQMATRRESDLISDPPVSPPTSGDFPAEDYLAAKANLVSPMMRKSAFHESEEDMEKK